MTSTAATQKQRQTRLRIVYSIFGTVLALILLTLLVTRLNVSLVSIGELLLAVPLWGHIILILITLLTFALSAHQWQDILQASSETQSNPASFLTLLFYTTLGGVLGLIVPIQISTPLVRGIMLRLQNQTSMVRGSATSVIEQSVALLVPVLFCVPGILALQGHISTGVWVVVMLVMIAFGWYLMVITLPWFMRLLVSRLQAQDDRIVRFRVLKILALRFESLVDTPLVGRNVLQSLYFMALVRYAVLMARIVMMMYLLQLNLPPIYSIYIVPVAQIIQLINLTPANLGFREWTWVGMLVMAGVDATVAGNFALAQRGLVILVTLASGVLVTAAYLLVRLLRSFSHAAQQGRG